ncbi:substrate-binding domain-containing protein [Vagococcus sp. BWB3-3]|uniref:Substrate-binding domain-containing protein n=1 Tax=Vagococcus allomyrinae TaxID=2794353 RepID=A0A940PE77_9ENTE|nr:substrate-binding domain-containing protein [Vagococcus allomyrinae]MBP1041198.1 substrate-binding domain-containing protein [Vagococcus allomyrinae]
MKKIVKFIGVLFVSLFLVACGSNEKDAGDNSKEQIGYAINNLNDTFQTYILDAAKASAKENDYGIRVENAKEDLIAQQDQVNTLIQNGVKALVVVPVDTSAMEPITKAAQEAKIPLVYVNRNPYAGKEKDMPKDVYYVGSEEITAGIMQMEFVGKELDGEGKIAVLMGILGNEGAMKRTEGVEETMKDQFPKMEILNKETAEWQRDKALAVAENWISTYGKDLKAIVANNDEMALGAVQAAKKNNRSDIIITGVDAIPDALDAVENGELAATVFQDAVGQGSGAITILSEALGGKAPKDQVTYVPFKLITSENVSEFK